MSSVVNMDHVIMARIAFELNNCNENIYNRGRYSSSVQASPQKNALCCCSYALFIRYLHADHSLNSARPLLFRIKGAVNFSSVKSGPH